MTEEKKFYLYLTVLRFLVFKVTNNLKRIYLDIDPNTNKMLLTAFYSNSPSALELELLDDIVTNSSAHIPDLVVVGQAKLLLALKKDEQHDYVVFAVYEDL